MKSLFLFFNVHRFSGLVTAAMCLLATTSWATPNDKAQPHVQPHVDLVLALDVSNSMDGLIGSAKQRLWDIVNELNQATPKPTLRVALIGYGNPRYGAAGGYVKVMQPFTDDLDAVSESLFSLATNGGEEYVARVVNRAVIELNWSSHPNASKVLFVAGNESASQDPQLQLDKVMLGAKAKGIVVNAIYCGNQQHNETASWRVAAKLGGGLFASIDQAAASIAKIATPFDEEIVQLNKALNETYIAFGREGEAKQKRQTEQDRKVAQLSKPAATSRVVTKASKLYRADSWDLVDAVENGQEITELKDEDLPEPMVAMSPSARVAFVEKQARRRAEIKQKVQHKAEQRQQFLDDHQPAERESGIGLDSAITEQLKTATAKTGMKFN